MRRTLTLAPANGARTGGRFRAGLESRYARKGGGCESLVLRTGRGSVAAERVDLCEGSECRV